MLHVRLSTFLLLLVPTGTIASSSEDTRPQRRFTAATKRHMWYSSHHHDKTTSSVKIDSKTIPKYVTDLFLPPVLHDDNGQDSNNFQVSVRQFEQQFLPKGYPKTKTWGFGDPSSPETFHNPSGSLEVTQNKYTYITWINELVVDAEECRASGFTSDEACRFLPHLMQDRNGVPIIDQQVHWANPNRECRNGKNKTDCEGNSVEPYLGPCPFVFHVHGAHVESRSDGYAESWFLPKASNIPEGISTEGSYFRSRFLPSANVPNDGEKFRYDAIAGDKFFAPAAEQAKGEGYTVFRYTNDEPTTALWYHDHTLGITRLNVMASAAGFFFIRKEDDGESNLAQEDSQGKQQRLPGPPPKEGQDPNGDPAVRASIREIPMVIQGMSFYKDGRKYYPAARAYFDYPECNDGTVYGNNELHKIKDEDRKLSKFKSYNNDNGYSSSRHALRGNPEEEDFFVRELGSSSKSKSGKSGKSGSSYSDYSSSRRALREIPNEEDLFARELKSSYSYHSGHSSSRSESTGPKASTETSTAEEISTFNELPYLPNVDSDILPVLNPEAFFDTMVVNGNTWPQFHVAPERYRLRFVNACDSRTLNLALFALPQGKKESGDYYDGHDKEDHDLFKHFSAENEVPFFVIGSDQGLLPKVVKVRTGYATPLTPGSSSIKEIPQNSPLMAMLTAPSERIDSIVDFSSYEEGTEIYLVNTGPDEPFGGFGDEGDEEYEPSDKDTTGQVLKFIIDKSLRNPDGDPSTSPYDLVLEERDDMPEHTAVRDLALKETVSEICVDEDNCQLKPVDCSEGSIDVASGENDLSAGPIIVQMGYDGSLGVNDVSLRRWFSPLQINESPKVNSTEIWDIWNWTPDGHPIHVHLVGFEILGRYSTQDPSKEVIEVQPWERGLKDVVFCYPNTVTRIKMHFDMSGYWMWHCHILSHEDNEMMLPFCVGEPGVDCPESLF